MVLMWLPAVATGVLQLWVWAVEVRRRRGRRLTAWHRHSKLLLSRWMLHCAGSWCLPGSPPHRCVGCHPMVSHPLRVTDGIAKWVSVFAGWH